MSVGPQTASKVALVEFESLEALNANAKILDLNA